MKYVALLSGGKDSCYNLLHCFKNGHELVATATLGPEQGKEELDSFLYQTVGQDAIEFVARCLEVPLYRRVIRGAAIEQGSEYGGRNGLDTGGVLGDETEDLFALLSNIKDRHPDIQGVSVGTILSNYQRVRVEHVCRRLLLTPLCYLWQRDQRELLNEMIESGMEAIFIKVAGIGLTVKHLGKSLADMQPTLMKLNDLYGSHICGEGGEYETLTLDCPMFKHRIHLKDVEVVMHSDNDFATVAFLRIKHAELEPKSNPHVIDIRVPPLLEVGIVEAHKVIMQSKGTSDSIERYQHTSLSNASCPITTACCSTELDSWVAVANVQCGVHSGAEISIEEEVGECFDILRRQLLTYSVSLSQIANINIFISSMDLFIPINTVYGTFFGISPPARACVAVDLPPPTRVRLDCVAYSGPNTAGRQALHVQGLSYWAPANIGPYSQAIVVDERVWISGQIGLIPSSLSLPSPRSLPLEISLSFQHVVRIRNALQNSSGGGWEGHVQGVLHWLADPGSLGHVKNAWEAYRKDDTPTIFLTVKALPKAALVELQFLLHTGRCLISQDSDGEPLLQLQATFVQENLSYGEYAVHWEMSQFDHIAASCTMMCVRRGDGKMTEFASCLKRKISLNRIWTRTISIRLFYTPPNISAGFSFLDCLFSERPPITPIPCRFISTRDADDWSFALCLLG